MRYQTFIFFLLFKIVNGSDYGSVDKCAESNGVY